VEYEKEQQKKQQQKKMSKKGKLTHSALSMLAIRILSNVSGVIASLFSGRRGWQETKNFYR
jgi:hypothetical protein